MSDQRAAPVAGGSGYLQVLKRRRNPERSQLSVPEAEAPRPDGDQLENAATPSSLARHQTQIDGLRSLPGATPELSLRYDRALAIFLNRLAQVMEGTAPEHAARAEGALAGAHALRHGAPTHGLACARLELVNSLLAQELQHGEPAKVDAERIAQTVVELSTQLEGRAGQSRALQAFAGLCAALLPPGDPAQRSQVRADLVDFVAEALPRAEVTVDSVHTLRQVVDSVRPPAFFPRPQTTQEEELTPQAVLRRARKALNLRAADQVKTAREFLKHTLRYHAHSSETERAFSDAIRKIERTAALNALAPHALQRNLNALFSSQINSVLDGRTTEPLHASAAILERVARTPFASMVVWRLNALLGASYKRRQIAPALHQAAAADTVLETIEALCEPQLVEVLKGPERRHLQERLDALPELERCKVLLALPRTDDLRGHPDASELLEVALRQAERHGPELIAAVLASRLENILELRDVREDGARRLATSLLDRSFSAYGSAAKKRLREIKSLAWALHKFSPDVDWGQKIDPGSDWPGLLPFLDPTARGDRQGGGAVVQALEESTGRMDGTPEEQERIVAHLLATSRALDQMGDLAPRVRRHLLEAWDYSFRLGGRMVGPSRVPDFLARHPELPAELALIAGSKLNGFDFGWLSSRCEQARTKAEERELRDLVYYCVDNDEFDVLNVLRSRPPSPEVERRAVAYVAQAFRGNWQIAPDVLDELRSGRDPGERMKAAPAGAADEHPLLEGLVPDHAWTEKGREQISAVRGPVDDFIAGLRRRQADNMTADDLRRGLDAALRAAALGQWPAARYESSLGRRLLQSLDEKQCELWREELVTGPEGFLLVDRNERRRECEQLVTGLLRALPLELPQLRFDGDVGDELKAEQRRLLEHLRHCKKGSGEHRALGGRLGAVNRALRLVALHEGLCDADGAGLHSEVAARLLPQLAAAAACLRQVGARGCSEAVSALIEALPQLVVVERKGLFAVDEDGLEPMLGSHLEGCMSPLKGTRRWGLMGALNDANTRMIRVYRDDRFLYRGLLRVWPVQFGDYRGPALWVEVPIAAAAGTPKEYAMLLRHAIAKGKALGIPVMTNDTARPTATALAKEARGLGLRVMEQDVTFEVREGSMPAYHSDNLLNLFGDGQRVDRKAGADGVWRVRDRPTVVFTHETVIPE